MTYRTYRLSKKLTAFEFTAYRLSKSLPLPLFTVTAHPSLYRYRSLPLPLIQIFTATAYHRLPLIQRLTATALYRLPLIQRLTATAYYRLPLITAYRLSGSNTANPTLKLLQV